MDTVEKLEQEFALMERGRREAEASLFRIVGTDPIIVRSPKTGKVLGILPRYDEEKIDKE